MLSRKTKPVLPAKPTVDEARRFVRALVHWVGPGFHPDTNFHNYVVIDSGRRSYEPSEADALNSDLDRAVEVLDSAGIDPCEIGLPVQHRLLRAMGVR